MNGVNNDTKKTNPVSDRYDVISKKFPGKLHSTKRFWLIGSGSWRLEVTVIELLKCDVELQSQPTRDQIQEQIRRVGKEGHQNKEEDLLLGSWISSKTRKRGLHPCSILYRQSRS